MKASKLLKEIKENIQKYDIGILKEKIKKEGINPISKQLSCYNLANYNDIISKEIKDDKDFEIPDEKIFAFKDELEKFFKGCSPESDASFRKFIESICFYLSFIAKKPLHPVGVDFGDYNTVHADKIEGKIVYSCDIRESVKDESKGYYTCKYCICKATSLK